MISDRHRKYGKLENRILHYLGGEYSFLNKLKNNVVSPRLTYLSGNNEFIHSFEDFAVSNTILAHPKGLLIRNENLADLEIVALTYQEIERIEVTLQPVIIQSFMGDVRDENSFLIRFKIKEEEDLIFCYQGSKNLKKFIDNRFPADKVHLKAKKRNENELTGDEFTRPSKEVYEMYGLGNLFPEPLWKKRRI